MTYRLRLAGRLAPEAIEVLTALWERSCRATHDFLETEEVSALRPCVALALAASPRLLLAEDDARQAAGMLGAADDKITLLFIEPAHFGRGAGRLLLSYAVSVWGCSRVDVNAENPGAAAFYRRMGMLEIGRSPQDDQGAPHPICHLALPETAWLWETPRCRIRALRPADVWELGEIPGGERLKAASGTAFRAVVAKASRRMIGVAGPAGIVLKPRHRNRGFEAELQCGWTRFEGSAEPPEIQEELDAQPQ